MSADIIAKADGLISKQDIRSKAKDMMTAGKTGGGASASMGFPRESMPYGTTTGDYAGGTNDIGRIIDADIYNYDRAEATRLGVETNVAQNKYATTQAERTQQLWEAKAFAAGPKTTASAETWEVPGAPVDLKKDAETKRPGRAAAALDSRPTGLSSGPKASRTLLGA